MYSHELNKYPNNQNNNLSNQLHSSSGNSAYSSALPNHIIEERQDVIFRKVRGILNKITPETFDKLSKELVNVGLNSPRTLRGVIYLLFDKALKDLKYSSLYAKLCQELSEKAPNFEQELGPNTFCKFLISKCEDEFERRRRATEDFDSKNELTDEEYEQRAIAKQKMLGNIKFICELGKKRLLQEEILHECIRGLLSKKKERPIQDQAQDLECLCQIMRTIGSLLDIQASRNLMNQYFERIDMFSKKPELPSRIRFMLRDVIDLRNNNWRPRPFQREDNVPQPLSKLREEAGLNLTNSSSFDGKLGNNRNLIGIGDLPKLHGNLLIDDEPSFTTTTDFHWGPDFLPIDRSFDAFSSSSATTGVKTATTSTSSANLPNATSTSNSITTGSSSSSFSPFNHQAPPQVQKTVPFQPPGHSEHFGGSRNNNNNRGFERQAPVPNNVTFTTNRHGIDSKRHGDELLPFEMRPHHPPLHVNSQRNDRESPMRGDYRVRAPPVGGANPPSRMQRSCNEESQSYNNPRRFGDSTRQAQQNVRGGNISPPNLRSRPNPRHVGLEAINQAPPSQPPPVHQNYRSESRNFYGGNVGGGDNFDNRDRRFQRPDHHYQDNEPRHHPRFSGSNNYRQPPAPRNERPPLPPMSREHQHHNQYHNSEKLSNQPESELNFNWRAAGTNAAPNVTQTSNNHNSALNSQAYNVQKTARSNDQYAESRITNERPVNKPANSNVTTPTKMSINQYVESNRKPEEAPKLERRPLLPDKISGGSVNDRDSSNLVGPRGVHHHNQHQPASSVINHQQVAHTQSVIESSNRFAETRPVRAGGRQRPPPRRPPLTDETMNQVQAVRSTTPPQPQNQSYRSNNPPRNLQGENYDKREQHQQRKFCPPPHSHDHEQQSRGYSDNRTTAPHHTERERNFNRAPIGSRNSQQFDNPQTTDSDRISNWRKGGGGGIGSNSGFKDGPNNNQNNNNSAKEQPVIQSIAPLLPKAPSKISDTNSFSLRPSHNLVGRATSVIAKQTSTLPTKPSTNVESNTIDGLQSKSSSREINDNTTKSNLKPVGRFQPEVAQALPHPPALPSVKLGFVEMPAMNEQQQQEVENEAVSPTRIAARDSYVNKFNVILLGLPSVSTQAMIHRTVAKIKELKIPKSFQHDCLFSAIKQSILKSENDRANIGKLFVQLIPSVFEGPSLIMAFKVIFEQMHALEVETPKVKSLVAGLLGRAILDGLLTLEEVGNVLSGGKHHPLFLLFLQKLEKNAGQAWLNEKFIASKINLIDMLPEVDRSKDRLASILKDRCLGFLDPMLTVEPDLWAQMKERDPSPAAVYRWIKDNVDQTIQSTPTFAHVLISCLLKYIHNLANEKSKVTVVALDGAGETDQQQADETESQSNKSSPSNSSQSTGDVENEILTKYQQVLQAILKEKHMQLATLYALQSFYHGLDFPKGSLLRWFHMLYDMNIVDDDVFFTWKEEINDEFPGKGQALFQVNTWLNWLAEAESEEEEDV